MPARPAASRETTPGCAPRRQLRFKIASTPDEFEAIHRLNHATFAIEIPQHAVRPNGRLIDRFHGDNTYAICLQGNSVVGMVAGRSMRPFSLDQKLEDLDRALPPHRKSVEIRLLAVNREFRHTTVFAQLVRLIARHFQNEGCDLAVICGVVQQAPLYRHLGFSPFAQPVGTSQARYQPMYLTLKALELGPLMRARATSAKRRASFLPGPVAVRSEVLAACAAAPCWHRDVSFMEQMRRVRSALCELVSARRVVIMVGTGTLGNDAVAAQLHCSGGPGLVISNGEFGERLIDHATRWGLTFAALRYDWGQPCNWSHLEASLRRSRPQWVWAALCETSTGVRNSKERLLTLCRSVGADLCLDAVSAVGLFPVDLEGVRFAAAVSGKGLAALPGLVAVFHDGRIARLGQTPRYLDLEHYEAAGGVPFTHSSNLLTALERSLTATRWEEKFERVESASIGLRRRLRELRLKVVAADADAAPGIVTVALPCGADSAAVAPALSAEGIQIAWASGYLRQRNWVQICLMGEFNLPAVERAARLLAREADRYRGA